MRENIKAGINSIISDTSIIGTDVYIGHNCIIEADVEIGNNVYIDNNTTIRKGTHLGNNSFVGNNCIIGEYQMDFITDRRPHNHELFIGAGSVIRSGTIIYTGSRIGYNFQTGHRVTIRENTEIGDCVSFGTLSDIQGHCRIGNYVRAHSNVHIAQYATLESFIWLFPYVVLTNDSTPPSENLSGVYICKFAVIASQSVILPGKKIGQDAFVGAGSVVTKDVAPYSLVSGNPAKNICDVRQINKTVGKAIYPWRQSFKRGMPWADIGFTDWMNDLSQTDIDYYQLNELSD